MAFAEPYSPPIWPEPSEKAKIVREAWLAESAEYVIGVSTAGNGPVSVWSKDEDRRMWRPGPYYDAVKFVELRAAEAVLRALDQSTTNPRTQNARQP